MTVELARKSERIGRDTVAVYMRELMEETMGKVVVDMKPDWNKWSKGKLANGERWGYLRSILKDKGTHPRLAQHCTLFPACTLSNAHEYRRQEGYAAKQGSRDRARDRVEGVYVWCVGWWVAPTCTKRIGRNELRKLVGLCSRRWPTVTCSAPGSSEGTVQYA